MMKTYPRSTLVRTAALLWLPLAMRCAVFAQDPAADDFERASLGANWVDQGGGTAAIVNGRDLGATTGAGAAVVWAHNPFGADQFCEAVLADGRPDTLLTQVFVRRRATDRARYGCHFNDENATGTGIANPRWEIKYDGVPTALTRILASVPTAMPSPGDTLRIEVSGASPVLIKGFHNGAKVIEATDSASDRITASGMIGMVSRVRRGGYTAPANSPIFASWRGGTTPSLGSWLASHGLPANAALDSDTDGDGIRLLAEYVLGLNPNEPTGAPFTTATRSSEMWFDYPVNADATDVQMTVEHSGDLSTWVSTGITYEPLGTTGSVRQMRARIGLLAGDPQRFARIKVISNGTPGVASANRVGKRLRHSRLPSSPGGNFEE